MANKGENEKMLTIDQPDFKARFSGHETFPVRYGWLYKVAEATAEKTESDNMFDPNEAMMRFGVGKNMVISMKYWAIAFDVIDANNNLTVFGEKLLGINGHDPFLEKPSTLWLLHWKLAASPERTTTWYWVFNHLNLRTFDKEQVANDLQRLVEEKSWGRVALSTLKRDVECFLRTYTINKNKFGSITEESLESPLSELDLIHQTETRGVYEFNRGPKENLSDEIFTYALVEYWEKQDSTAVTMTLERLAYDPESPGRVFKLDENSVADRLSKIEEITHGAFVWADTAGIRQVQQMNEIDKFDVLKRAYHG